MTRLGQAALRSIIREGSMPVPGIACWMWIRGYGTHEYGVVWVDGKATTAPRVAFNAWNDEPLKPGEEACHSCDWHPCCNPEHLHRGTQRSNMLEMKLRNRQQRKFHPMDIVDIRKRAARGEKHTAIAASFRCSKQAIQQIVARITWSHIE